MSYEQTPQGKDPRSWSLAKRRASFRRHLATYIIILGFLWVLWFITGTGDYGRGRVPWPVWAMLGWGIGLAFHFFSAYSSGGTDAIEKEYNQLQNRQNQ
jgi:hypothetical protein